MADDTVNTRTSQESQVMQRTLMLVQHGSEVVACFLLTLWGASVAADKTWMEFVEHVGLGATGMAVVLVMVCWAGKRFFSIVEKWGDKWVESELGRREQDAEACRKQAESLVRLAESMEGHAAALHQIELELARLHANGHGPKDG